MDENTKKDKVNCYLDKIDNYITEFGKRCQEENKKSPNKYIRRQPQEKFSLIKELESDIKKLRKESDKKFNNEKDDLIRYTKTHSSPSRSINNLIKKIHSDLESLSEYYPKQRNSYGKDKNKAKRSNEDLFDQNRDNQINQMKKRREDETEKTKRQMYKNKKYFDLETKHKYLSDDNFKDTTQTEPTRIQEYEQISKNKKENKKYQESPLQKDGEIKKIKETQNEKKRNVLLADQNENNDKLTKENKDLKHKIQNLHNILQNKEEELDQLRTQQKKLKLQIQSETNQNEQKLQQALKQNDNLIQEQKILKRELEEMKKLNQKNINIINEFQKFSNEDASKDALINKLETSLKSTSHKKNQYEKIIRQMISIKQQLEKENKGIKEQLDSKENEIRQVKPQIYDYQMKIKQLESEIESSKFNNNNNNNQIERLNHQYQDQVNENEKLREEIKQQNDKYEKLQESLNKIKQENNTLREALLESNKKQNEKSDQILKLHENIRQKDEEIKKVQIEAEDKLSQMSSDIEKDQTKNTIIKQLKSKLKAKNEESLQIVNKFKEILDKRKQKIETLTNNNKQLQQNYNNLNQEAKQLKLENENHKKQVNQLQKQIDVYLTDSSGTANNIKQQYDDLLQQMKDKVSTLQNENNTKQNEISNIENELTKLKQENNKLSKHIKQISEESNNKDLTIDDLNKQNMILQKQIDIYSIDSSENISNIKQQYDDLLQQMKDKVSTLQNENNTKQNEISNIENKLTQLKQKYTECLTLSKQIIKESKNKDLTIDDLNKQNMTLQKQIDIHSIDSSENINNIKQQYDDLLQQMKDKVSTLQNENNTKQNEISNIENELTKLKQENNKLSKHIKQISEESNNKDLTIDDLNKQNMILQKQIDIYSTNSSKNISNIKQQYDDLLQQMKDELSTLRNENNTKQNEISNIENKLTQLKQKYTECLTYNKQIIEESNNKDLTIDNLNKQNMTLQKQIDIYSIDSSENINNIKQQYENLLQQTKDKVSTLQNENNAKQNKISNIENELTQLKQEYTECLTYNKQITEESKLKNLDIEKLQNQVQKLQIQKETISSNSSTNLEGIKKYESLLAQNKNEISELEKENNEKQNKILMMTKNFIQLKNEYLNINEQTKQNANSIAMKDTINERLKERIKELNQTNEELNNTITELRNQLKTKSNDSSTEIKNIKQQYERIIAKKDIEISKLREDNDESQATISEFETNLQQIQKEYIKIQNQEEQNMNDEIMKDSIIEHLKQRVDELNQTNEGLNNAITELRNQLKTKSTDSSTYIENTKQQYERIIKEKDIEISKLREDNDESQATIAEFETNLQQIQKEYIKIQNQEEQNMNDEIMKDSIIEHLKQRIIELQKQINTTPTVSSTDIENIKQHYERIIKEKDIKISKLQEDNDESQATISEFETNLQQIQKEYIKIQNQEEQNMNDEIMKDSIIEHLKQRITELQKQINTAPTVSSTDINSIKQHYERIIKEKDIEILKLREDNDESQATISEFETNLQQIQKEYIKIQNQEEQNMNDEIMKDSIIEHLKQRIIELQKQGQPPNSSKSAIIEKLGEENDRLKELLDEKESEIKRLKMRPATTSPEIDDDESAQQLIEENEMLKCKIKSISSKADQLAQQLEDINNENLPMKICMLEELVKRLKQRIKDLSS